jgi:hypothetical protein
MARTNVRGSQINDGSVQRVDLDTTTTGQAVIRKVIAGTGISISATGVDAGTGDATINLSVPVSISHGGSGQTTQQTAINALTNASAASTAQVLTRDGSGNAIFSSVPYPVTSVFGRSGAVVAQSGDYTNAQVGLGNVTNDAQLKRAANDFNSFTSKATPVGADILLVEDSAASGAKKYITISSISHSILSNIGTNTHAQIDTHIANTSNPHSTTASQVGLGNVSNDAQLKRAANDFNTFTNKTSPTSSDIVLIEDAAASGVKKYSTIAQIISNNGVSSFNGRIGAVVPQSGDYTNAQVGLGNVTNDAQLKRAANDFNSFTIKATPVNADILIIEDSAAAGVKKYITAGTLPYPVTSVFGRSGAVVAQSGDYTNAQVGLGNVTNDAQLKRAAADFSTFTAKNTPVGADVFLFEDSAAAGAKKQTTLTNIGAQALFNANKIQGTNIVITSLTNNDILQYNGTNFVNINHPIVAPTAWTPTIGAVNGTISSTTVTYARYWRMGSFVHYSMEISTQFAATVDYLTFTLPTGLTTVAGSRTYAGTGGIFTSAAATLIRGLYTSVTTGDCRIFYDSGATFPNQGTNVILRVSGWYEV